MLENDDEFLLFRPYVGILALVVGRVYLLHIKKYHTEENGPRTRSESDYSLKIRMYGN